MGNSKPIKQRQPTDREWREFDKNVHPKFQEGDVCISKMKKGIVTQRFWGQNEEKGFCIIPRSAEGVGAGQRFPKTGYAKKAYVMDFMAKHAPQTAARLSPAKPTSAPEKRTLAELGPPPGYKDLPKDTKHDSAEDPAGRRIEFREMTGIVHQIVRLDKPILPKAEPGKINK